MLKRKFAVMLGICSLLGVFCLSACANKNDFGVVEESVETESQSENGADTLEETVETEEETETEASNASSSSVVLYDTRQNNLTFTESVNRFNSALYKCMNFTDDNVVYSPYSLTTALAMLDEMADGYTSMHIRMLLGISELSQYTDGMKALVDRYEGNGLVSANALYVQEGFAYADDSDALVMLPLKQDFNAEIHEVDFVGHIEDVHKDIEKWVAKNTNNLIPDYKSISTSDTVSDLLNVLAFDAKWNVPFSANDTYTEEFHGTEGSTEVDMMHQHDRYLSYLDDFSGVRVIGLSYENGAEMDILLPVDENASVHNVVSDIDMTELFTALDNTEEERIKTLALPKVFTRVSLDSDALKSALDSLGLVDVFNENADFSKLSENIYVGDISHETVLNIDEEGTQAASVTEVVLDKAIAMPNEDGVDFIVNRPFAFVIRDSETNTILFTGEINQL